MKIFRRTARNTVFDHKKDLDILKDLNAKSVDNNLRRYK
jgi:hypothetical protein